MAFDGCDGGDPPCWAHLFEDAGLDADDGPGMHHQASGAAPAAAVDLLARATAASADGAAWTHQSDDLSVNLLVFAAGSGVAAHVNAEVDVLLVGVAGAGVVESDGVEHALTAGTALVVPKGARRATRATSDPFAYLSCHRRRGGLWPSR